MSDSSESHEEDEEDEEGDQEESGEENEDDEEKDGILEDEWLEDDSEEERDSEVEEDEEEVGMEEVESDEEGDEDHDEGDQSNGENDGESAEKNATKKSSKTDKNAISSKATSEDTTVALTEEEQQCASFFLLHAHARCSCACNRDVSGLLSKKIFLGFFCFSCVTVLLRQEAASVLRGAAAKVEYIEDDRSRHRRILRDAVLIKSDVRNLHCAPSALCWCPGYSVLGLSDCLPGGALVGACLAVQTNRPDGRGIFRGGQRSGIQPDHVHREKRASPARVRNTRAESRAGGSVRLQPQLVVAPPPQRRHHPRIVRGARHDHPRDSAPAGLHVRYGSVATRCGTSFLFRIVGVH